MSMFPVRYLFVLATAMSLAACVPSGQPTSSDQTGAVATKAGVAASQISVASAGYQAAPGYPGFLTDFTGTLQSDTTYKFMNFPNGLYVPAGVSNVTFFGCRFASNAVDDANVAVYGDNVVFDYSSFVPSRVVAPPVAYGQGYQYGIDVRESVRVTVDHSDFWGWGNGIQFGFSSREKPFVVRNSYFHDARDDGGIDHTDAILENYGGQSYMVFDNNRIVSAGNTNGLALQNGDRRGYQNVTITNNYFSGFGYTLNLCGYFEGCSEINFSGNTYGTDIKPVWGPLYSWESGNGNVWRCNRWHVAPGGYSARAADDGKYWLSDGSLSALDGDGGTCGDTPAPPPVTPPSEPAPANPAPAAGEQTVLTTQAPQTLNNSDGAGVNYELGMRFMATSAGEIRAIRFYKASRETGAHTGRIFSASGQQLASVTFTDESASGWQQARLASPLAIDANTEYTVSVNTGNTFYVSTNNGMDAQLGNGNLRSVVGNNGVFGPVGQRPTRNWRNSNYFRDVVFAPGAAAPAPEPTPGPAPDPTPVPAQSVISTQVPSAKKSSDGAGVNYELGMRFSANVDGYVKAIRFYKSARETGAHTGKIYSSTGAVLATAAFGGESASGWQEQALAAPLAIQAGATYVVSVNTGGTYYVDTVSGFAKPRTSGNLSSPAGAGVFGPVGAMPDQVYRNSNYFRDVVFVPGATAPAPSTEPVPDPEPAPAPAPVPPTSGITHGKDLTLALVGPAAIGITAFTTGGGATIYDASSASYIRKVNASATYDGFAVNGPHLLIQGMDISGMFDIYSPLPVVIRGSRIRGAGYWSVSTRPGAGPVYVLYCDLGGTAIGRASDHAITTGNDGGNVFARNHLSFIGDGFSIGSQRDQILENYLEKFDGGGDAHNDGLQAPGNNDGLVIARNKILLNTGETGTINLGTWGGGVARYVTIDSNYLAGGGYTFYGGGSVGEHSNHIVVTNNIFGYDFFPNLGYWGAVAYWDSTGPGNTWRNNRDTKGNPVGAD